MYGYDNPVNLTDPSGRTPYCGEYDRADLTQWFIDELNENRKGWIAEMIRDNLWKWEDPVHGGNPLSLSAAFLTFYDAVKTHGLWDFKWEIHHLIGESIRIEDVWYRWDVPGNVHFGYIGIAVGFDEQLLHCGADYATDGRFCSGSDPMEDYEAIEAGFDIWKLSGGRDVDDATLRIAFASHPLIANEIPKWPKPLAFALTWPYPVGTFDDGSSGWFVKHR